MNWNPITAVLDVGERVLDKFKMSKDEKERLKQEWRLATLEAAQEEKGAFREFVLRYEGEAAELPKLLLYMRSSVRPVVTYVVLALVVWLQYAVFQDPSAELGRLPDLVYSLAWIVFAFWFGDRLLKRSGLGDVLMQFAQRGKKEQS